MAFEVGAIVASLELRKKQWDASIKKVKADQKSLSGLVLRNSAQFKKMGRSMTIAGTAIVGAVGMMVKAHATFDHAMNESLAIMGNVSNKMRKDMAEAALDMSTKSTFSAKELGQAYYYLASAGMNAAQSIKALPVVTKFAQAGAFDLATATDLLTDAQTALGLSSKNAIENQKNLIKVSDVLVKANTLANASVEQFSEALTNRAAASLVNVNKTMYEGVAVLAAYADKGVKGLKAGMRLSMMLNAMDIAARKNKEAWDENGLSLFDAQGEMRNIADIIGDLENKLGDMTTEQRAATLASLGFNVRTKASILTLMGSSEKIRQFEKDLKNAGGMTEQVAKKQLYSLVNQLTVLKNWVTKVSISIGETLGPALKETIDKLKITIGRVGEWIKEHPKLTEIIAKSAVAVGSLMMVLGPLMMALPGLVIILPKLAAGFTALLGPIGAVTLAATQFGIVVNKVIDNYKKKQDAEMDALVEAAKGHAEFYAFRRQLIADEIVTVEEWAEIYKKHGKNYKRVMHAIATLPEYEEIREALKKQKESLEESSEATLTAAESTEIYSRALRVFRGEVGQIDWEALMPPSELMARWEEFYNMVETPELDLIWEQQMQNMEEDTLNFMSSIIPGMKFMTESSTKNVQKMGEKTKITFGQIASDVGTALHMIGSRNKAVAYATAIINTAQAVSKALSAYPPPLSFAMAAAQFAAGMAEVATIKKQEIPSAERGLYVPTPTVIEAGHGPFGELVVPLERAPIEITRQPNIMTEAGVKIDLNFYSPLISTTGLSDRDIDDAAEYLLDRVKQQFERYGGKLNA